MHMHQALSVGAGITGVNITTSGTSASATIPNALGGSKPNYVYVVATAAAHIRWGKGAQTAVTTDTLLPANVPVILHVNGCDTIAAIQNSGAGTVNIVPQEFSR